MSQTLEERLSAIQDNEDQDAIMALHDELEDIDERIFVLQAALEMECYREVIERLAPLTGDVEAPGEDPRPWTLRGLAHFYDDELGDAQAALSAALKVDARHVPALMARAMVLRDLDYERAGALDIEKAQWLLSDVDAETEDEEQRDLKAQVHNLLATFALEDDERQEAIKMLRVASDVGVDDADYPLDLARLLSLEGDPAGALDAVNAAIERDDLLLEALLMRCQLLGALARHEEAVHAAREAVAIDDEEPYSHTQLAAMLVMAGRFDEALDAANKAIALEPELPDAHQLRVAALQALKRDAEITEADRNLMGELPDLPGFIYGERFDPYEEAGDVLAEMGNMDPSQLMGLADQFFQTGQLPEQLRPLMEQVMQDLPAMLQQMPDIMQNLPPDMANQLAAMTGGGMPDLSQLQNKKSDD